MRPIFVKPASCLKGAISLSGDKSIAHRAVILSAISRGKTKILNFPLNLDCFSTLNLFKKLGIKILRSKTTLIIYGKGLNGLKQPKGTIFVGNSGTTLRIALGVLAGQKFKVKLSAGESLYKRPMLRITKPLRMMGAHIDARVSGVEEYSPISITGGNLKGINYKISVASAQVKSSLLLAGLYACGQTQVEEKIKTRDHTERMLKLFKADLKVRLNKITIKSAKELISPKQIYVPADISSASFFLVLAAIMPDAKIILKKVGLNPSRIGIIKVLKQMGADIKLSAISHQSSVKYEPAGDVIISSSILKGIVVKKEQIPSLIDELPVLMVAACFAKGETIFQGVGELRVKETDRIKSMMENLRKMGADIALVKEGKNENILVKQVKELRGARVRSFGDHRTAMSMVVAALRAKGSTWIDDISCINKSFPSFLKVLRKIT